MLHTYVYIYTRIFTGIVVSVQSQSLVPRSATAVSYCAATQPTSTLGEENFKIQIWDGGFFVFEPLTVKIVDLINFGPIEG